MATILKMFIFLYSKKQKKMLIQILQSDREDVNSGDETSEYVRSVAHKMKEIASKTIA